jgi:hypothetical protein
MMAVNMCGHRPQSITSYILFGCQSVGKNTSAVYEVVVDLMLPCSSRTLVSTHRSKQRYNPEGQRRCSGVLCTGGRNRP